MWRGRGCLAKVACTAENSPRVAMWSSCKQRVNGAPSIASPLNSTTRCTSSETGRIRFLGSTVSSTKLSDLLGPHSIHSAPQRRGKTVPLGLVFVCQSELTEFLAELNAFGAELSQFSLSKLDSPNSHPPVSQSGCTS